MRECQPAWPRNSETDLCSMVHALWLGLSSLLAQPSALRRAGEPESLQADAASFRSFVLSALWDDETYVGAIRSQLTFWVQEIDVSLLLGHVEDFFLVPCLLLSALSIIVACRCRSSSSKPFWMRTSSGRSVRQQQSTAAVC